MCVLLCICCIRIHVHVCILSTIATDPDEMLSFASNLLCLDIGDGLLSLVNDAETKARETVHQAEEELEGQLIIIFM